MAGEIHEPFRLSFQVDSLHSGSISFGRFETESLSWERRSSFSHNRYLEEVEKYSKPGSVTEKKAYFEAHFKKKALLRQGSSECQNGAEYQGGVNDILENIDQGDEFEHDNECSHFAHFDESPVQSEYDRENEEVKHGREDRRALYSEPQIGPAIQSADVVDTVFENVTKNVQQTATENFLLDKTEAEKRVNKNPHNEEGYLDVTSKAITPLPNNCAGDGDETAVLEHERNFFPKLKTSSETKVLETRLKSQVNITEVQRSISSEASSDSAKKPSRSEREGSRRMKAEKQLAKTVAPTTRSICKTSKIENSNTSKAKIIQENKSRKELRGKKFVEHQLSATKKVVHGIFQTSHRLKQNVSSAKPTMKQNAPVLNFKCDGRPEKRKEEETEAEIKQFRKSLNFKASPMPSFYREAVRGSDKNENELPRSKAKLRTKSSSPGAGVAERSPSYLKSGKNQFRYSSRPLNITDRPEVTGATNCTSPEPSEASASTSTPAMKKKYSPQPEINNRMFKMKEKEKAKNINPPKYTVFDGSKVKISQKAEGKQKVGSGRGSYNMVRRDMKSIGVNCSRRGNVAVGVAS